MIQPSWSISQRTPNLVKSPQFLASDGLFASDTVYVNVFIQMFGLFPGQKLNSLVFNFERTCRELWRITLPLWPPGELRGALDHAPTCSDLDLALKNLPASTSKVNNERSQSQRLSGRKAQSIGCQRMRFSAVFTGFFWCGDRIHVIDVDHASDW